MNVQRFETMQQRKLAPYSQAASLRDEYARVASMEISNETTPNIQERVHQPGHLSQMSLHLKHVKDYNSVADQAGNRYASNTQATSLLHSRKDASRLRGPISDSMETENIKIN